MVSGRIISIAHLRVETTIFEKTRYVSYAILCSEHSKAGNCNKKGNNNMHAEAEKNSYYFRKNLMLLSLNILINNILI